MMPGVLGRQRPTLVLNRLGMPGGLKRAQIEDALKTKVDVAIPDLPRQISNAVTMGDPAAAQSGAFRAAIIELSTQVGAANGPAIRSLDGKMGRLGRLLGFGR
jgi:pilus assembly protein CpaE